MRINFFLNKLCLLVNILIILLTNTSINAIKNKTNKQSKPHKKNLQSKTSESNIYNYNTTNNNKTKTKFNYMTLKLTKKTSSIFDSSSTLTTSTKLSETSANPKPNFSQNQNYITKLSQQFFQLSDASKLNIKHLSLSALTSLQNAIAIEPIKIRNYFNMQYYASLSVGAEKQEFSVIIDTGSNLLWLPSANCSLCRNYTNKYDESLSSTNNLLNKTLNITYGKGFVEGDLFSDDVFIAENFGVKQMHFLSVDKELELDGTISDGLLGLGLYFEHNKNFSFIYGLFQQGLINKPAFTFYLTDSSFSNRLYIGDIKENKQLEGFWAQAQSCQVNNSSRIFSKYWACDVLSISTTNETFEKSGLDFLQDSSDNKSFNNNLENKISNDNLNSNNLNNNTSNNNLSNNLNPNSATNYQFKTTSKAIFDTGSSLVFIPPNDFLNLIPYFSAKAQNNLCTLSYAFQIHCKCSSPTDFGSIYLNFATGKFIIDFESIIDYMPSSEYQCRFQIILDLFNFDTWILGDSVLRYSFITFDMEKREISFLQNSGMITDSNIVGADNTDSNIAGKGPENPKGSKDNVLEWIYRYFVYLVVFGLAALFAYAVYRCYADKDDGVVDDGQYNRLANN